MTSERDFWNRLVFIFGMILFWGMAFYLFITGNWLGGIVTIAFIALMSWGTFASEKKEPRAGS